MEFIDNVCKCLLIESRKVITMKKVNWISIVGLSIIFIYMIYLIIKYSVNETNRNTLGFVIIPIAGLIALVSLIVICISIRNIKKNK